MLAFFFPLKENYSSLGSVNCSADDTIKDINSNNLESLL